MLKLHKIRAGVMVFATSLLTIGIMSQTLVSASGSQQLKGTFVYEPVLVPYCPAGQICPQFKLPFPYPYKLRIYQDIGAIRVPVTKNLAVRGPATGSIQLHPGTYDVTYDAGNLATEYPRPFTIYAGQTNGIQTLHIILPANGQNYFQDYNGCVYNLGGSSASPDYCQVK